MIGRLFLLSAFPATWLDGNCSLSTAMIAGLCTFGILLAMDSGRGIRTLPSTIMARFMLGTSIFIFVLFYLFGNKASGRAYFTFADCFVVGFWVTVAITLFFWAFFWLGKFLVSSDPEYQGWRQAGGHYFWDTLPRILNPDSDLIRRGGFAEPAYSSFVPPADWQFQCPKCGSRVQHSVDVCWSCNYGADGDSTAYFDRYGR